MSRPSRHVLANCPSCGDMVICVDCGNNCCNAGTGTVNGVRCGCDEAYEDQSAFNKDPESVRFAVDIRDVDMSARLDVMSLIRQRGGQSDPS